MKTLLEVFFATLFTGIFISFLPTIIGFLSLCVIIVFMLSFLKKICSDDEESSDGTSQPENYIEVNVEMERQNKQETIERKAENTGRCTGSRNYRRTYDDYYDDYYDDRYDDIPQEEGDGFRGTGAPFL